ncbi:MAG: SEC-C metal-binding domain-containing protein [Planctomycetota bacterium]
MDNSPEIRLAAAAFLDSESAHGLPYPRASVRTCVEGFLACAYAELGKAPHLLEGEDLEQILLERLPAHFGVRDPLAEAVEDILTAYLRDLGQRAVVLHAYELERALLTHAAAFRQRVRAGDLAGRAPGKTAPPFVHRADKTGRNDPCPCGSGRKFKQCCRQLGP